MILKVISANSVDPDQTAPDLGPHCLPVYKNRFEKFAQIFSRRHKQTTFSDAAFLGVLRVKYFVRLGHVLVPDISSFVVVNDHDRIIFYNRRTCRLQDQFNSSHAE